jgi:hypothetical protein
MKTKLPKLVIFLLSIFIVGCSSANYDTFAACISKSGATFYGAFWCPHCQNQKKMFGGSADLLPYVECSTPDGKAQTQECIDKSIEGYPTWEFADRSRLRGEVSLETLSEKTGCPIGQQ